MAEIVKNDFFSIDEESGFLYITVFNSGYSLKEFNAFLEEYPRIDVKQFMNLKTALAEAANAKTNIGVYRPLVICNVSKDKMKATIKINESDDNFYMDINKYIDMSFEAMKSLGVKEGIFLDVLRDKIYPRKEIVVAEGIPPVDGEDAEVTYFKLSERKPTIREDGNADYYDMNFIDEVRKGDWLGEKIPATSGVDGRTVTGDILPAKKGKDRRLLFDKKSVEEVEENGKSILKARNDGVVRFVDGKITVGRHLTIDGDVGLETGNIEFDGSVEITGTVLPGFSVIATEDISILSELGIRGAQLIKSEKGDVFIKGGIFGQEKTVIKAGKNIFIKHANECFLEAVKDINIGYYSMGSELVAENVITDNRKGKLIGGRIVAKGKVVAGYIGNKLELKTHIHVEGFDRQVIQNELNELLMHYKKVVQGVESLKRQLDIYESFENQLNEKQKQEYDTHILKYEDMISEVSYIEEIRKSMMKLLETKGEGQIEITQSAFPEVMLEIKSLKKKLNNNIRGSFYVIGKELKYE